MFKGIPGSHFEWLSLIMENEMKLKKYSLAREDKSKPEINSGEILVDTVGYVSNKRRIQALEKAGKKLLNYRMLDNKMYDVPYGKEPSDDLILNPLRQKGFDFSDASFILNALDIKLKNTKKAMEDLKNDKIRKDSDDGKDKDLVMEKENNRKVTSKDKDEITSDES